MELYIVATCSSPRMNLHSQSALQTGLVKKGTHIFTTIGHLRPHLSNRISRSVIQTRSDVTTTYLSPANPKAAAPTLRSKCVKVIAVVICVFEVS